MAGSDTTNKDDGHLVFRTSPSQGSIAERFRIFSDGKFGFGTGGSLSENTMAEFTRSVGGGAIGANITIRNSSTNSVNNVAELRLKTGHGVARFYKYNTGSTVIQSHTSGASDLLLYADGASNLRLHTNANERLRIDSDGKILSGHTAALTKFHGPASTTKRNPHIQVNGTNVNSASMSLTSWDNNVNAYYGPAIYLAKSGSSTIGTNSRVSNQNSILAVSYTHLTLPTKA